MEGIAVKVTSVEEFSTIVSADNSKLISGAKSLSNINTSIPVASFKTAFAGTEGVNTIVSVGSKDSSSIANTVRIPSVDPALIFTVAPRL